MTFEDVDINGGRPRVSPLDPPYCLETDICDVFRQTYTSGNFYLDDLIPPSGELSGVSTGDLVTSEKLTLNGWGADSQSGLDYGQLIYILMALGRISVLDLILIFRTNGIFAILPCPLRMVRSVLHFSFMMSLVTPPL